MADVDFDNITQDVRGIVYPGKLRLKENDFMFKNEKTGKVDHFLRAEIVEAQWIARATGLGLRIKLKNNTQHLYDGFGELEAENVTNFFKKFFGVEIQRREFSYKGYNWGEVEFNGDTLEFTVKNALAYQFPLSNVSNASVNKNEVVLEFHQNDDSEICLSEMRLYTPGTESEREGRAAIMYSKITQKADIIQVTGDSLVEFKQLQCLQPRGRYDVKLYSSFIHLHGKSFDFKIPKNTITRLLLLPHPDNRQIFFAIQLDPPIKHGQTRYHFAIFLFDKDSHVDLEMTAGDEWLQEHYGGKLTQNLAGPEYEVVARVFKVLFEQKVTVPGTFSAKGGGHAVACSYKASVGLLYPLERGFTFIPRPPISIRFDEIISVNFSRGTGAQRSFDFEVETRNGLSHAFTSIERDEYHQLYDFVSAKKLRVKNINPDARSGASGGPSLDEAWSSSEESHDAYMEKVKTEGRDAMGDDDDDDDEDDEDFKPPPESDASELAEEYDSNVSTTTSSESSDESESGSGSNQNESDAEPKPKKRHEQQSKKVSKTKEQKRPTKTKRAKDKNAPTRPPTAYFLWFNENREDIKAELGSSVVTEVAKAAGEKWKQLDSESKAIYQAKVDKLKEKYEEEMRIYKDRVASGEIQPSILPAKGGKSKAPASRSPKKQGAGGGFKSQEYVASSASSSSGLSDIDDGGDDKGSRDAKPTESESD